MTNINLPVGSVGTPYTGLVAAAGGGGITWTVPPFQYVPPGLTVHANGVIVRSTRRQEKIGRELEAFAKRGGYRIHEDSDLRKLVAYLNEYPTVIQGNFDPSFLSLPDEILITAGSGLASIW